jgi:hypothetical protein
VLKARLVSALETKMWWTAFKPCFQFQLAPLQHGGVLLEELRQPRQGGALQLATIKTRVESAPGVCNQRVKLKCDEPLSNLAFNFNVRHYTTAFTALPYNHLDAFRLPTLNAKVGRCRLTLSNPELKARLLSALETKMWWTAFKRCLSASAFSAWN